MILEDAPVEGQAVDAAPKTENKGEFGYKSSTPDAPSEDSNADATAAPEKGSADAPVGQPAGNEGDAPSGEEGTWFNIPGSEPDNNGGAPAAADEPEGGDNNADTPAPASIEWRELIKEVPREELLKELGIEDDDEFEKEFKKFRRNGGDPIEYLEAKSRDWTKVDDTTLAMQALAEQNPTLSKEELQLLFEENYFQDEDATDREKELGKIKIKTDADRKRRSEIERQKQFTIPDKPLPAADEDTVLAKYREEYLKKAEETVKADNDNYLADPTTQEIIKSKKVTVPLGKDGRFSIGVDPAKITGYFTDPEVYSQIQFGEGGKPDMQTEQALAAIRVLGLGEYNRLLVDYAKSQAKKEIIEEGQNVGKTGHATPPPAQKGPIRWVETGGN